MEAIPGTPWLQNHSVMAKLSVMHYSFQKTAHLKMAEQATFSPTTALSVHYYECKKCKASFWEFVVK
jgi:hypothetical protein